MTPPNRHTRIVGVDGSPSSVEALRRAADRAELTAGEPHPQEPARGSGENR